MQNVRKKQRIKKNILIVVGVLIAVLLAIELSPAGGTVRYYAIWYKCGQQPVVAQGSGLFNAKAAWYFLPPKVDIFPGWQTYFCTPIEAEREGYSAKRDVYDFPHLRETGEPSRFLREWREHRNIE